MKPTVCVSFVFVEVRPRSERPRAFPQDQESFRKQMRVAPLTSRFLDACRRRPTDVRPVWFMRQAGRYLKQYRDIRSKHSMLEMCLRPDIAAAVPLQPVEILDVDAAVF